MADNINELLSAIGIMALAFIDAPVQIVIVCSALYLGVIIRNSLKGDDVDET